LAASLTVSYPHATDKYRNPSLALAYMKVLRLFTKQNCPLCEKAVETVKHAKEKLDFEVELVYVDSNSELEKRFGERVPIGFIDGKVVFKYRTTSEELVKRILKLSKD